MTKKLKRWTNEEIEFLKNNFATMMHKDIAIALGRTEGAIRAKCFDLNLYKKEYPWTQEELDYLLNNYKTKTYREIGVELGRSLDAVRSKAALLNLNKERYHCDYDYFKVIDTEEKAYWLGFIFADGWTYLSRSTEAGCLGIELQKGDVGHLRKFNKSIHGNYKITFRTRENTTDVAPGIHDMCAIRIFSREMTDDLIEKGVVPNKSLVKEFPTDIPEDLIRHFIRGYFDGNGCVSAGKDKDKRINALHFSFHSGSLNFITSIKNILARYNIFSSDIAPTVFNEKLGKETCFYFSVYSNYSNSQKFYSFLYDNYSISLDRKFNKAKHIKKVIDKKKA